MKNKKLLIAFFSICLITGFVLYKYTYHPHAQIEDRQSAFIGEAEDLISKIAQDQMILLDKAVEISGKITSTDNQSITINSSVYCQLKAGQSTNGLSVGQEINIKGRYIGYDDLLEEIKLDQTIIK